MTLFAVLTLVAALGPISWLVHAPIAGRRQWLVASSAAAAMSTSALLVGPWALLSVYLRPVIALALIGALVLTANRAARRGANHDQPAPSPRPSMLHVVLACIFAVVVMNAVAGRFPPQGTADLRFPLEGGMYAVLQGGGSMRAESFPPLVPVRQVRTRPGQTERTWESRARHRPGTLDGVREFS